MFNRPKVSVTKPSRLNELLDVLNKHLDVFKEFDQVAGIMLGGGMSRGYADYLSEIDVVVFLHDSAYKGYKEKKTPVSLGITILDGYMYDVKIVNYEEELQREYDSVALWDLSYAKILYDNKEELKTLFDRKLVTKVDEGQAEGLMFEVWWNFRLAGDIWIHREDALQGHYCLNNAIKPLLSSLFIANREYIPHDKWLIHMSRTLEWKPDNYEELLAKVMDTGDLSVESLRARQQSIERLWNAIDAHICQSIDFKCGLKLMYKGSYESLKKAAEQGECTVEEWEQFSSLEALNYEPLFGITKVVGNKVVVDQDKLKAIEEKDMYQWFFDVVGAVRENIE